MHITTCYVKAWSEGAWVLELKQKKSQNYGLTIILPPDLLTFAIESLQIWDEYVTGRNTLKIRTNANWGKI